MRRRLPRLRKQRPVRKLWSGDPMFNPRPGSSELEEWENEIEDWMMSGPGGLPGATS